MNLDAIELEVIKSRLEEAALTMENRLFHSGYSPILRESADGSAAILDRHGGVVMAVGLPIHLIPYYRTAQAVIAQWGERMQPGDSFLINDPYLGGALHVPDTAIVTPFFFEGAIVAYCASIAHKPDIGGLVIGSSSAAAREIYHEGLLFPGVRYWTAQGVNPEYEAMLRSNTRSADETIGDLRAQVGCTRIGCERLHELFSHYGAAVMTEAFEQLITRSERRVRDRLAALPDGEARAQAFLDHDGVAVDQPIGVRVRIEKRGDRLTLDLSESDANVNGPINLRPQAAESGGALAVLGLLDPTIPINDGCRRAIECINPPGRITHAIKPRPINNYYPSMHLVYSVTQKAFAQLMPGQAIAPAGLGVGGFAIGFARTRAGKPGALYELMATSLGGTAAADGSFVSMAMAQITPSQPVEIVETEYPVQVTRFEPITDSAGAGRMRGGVGYVREYRLLEDAVVTVRMGQFRHPSWGVVGGEGPPPSSATLNDGTERREALPILLTRPMHVGDRLAMRLSGGGGYGPPAERSPASVAADVADGLVSVEAAERTYRVRIDPGSLAADAVATAALRER